MLQQETAQLHNLDERDVAFESLQHIVSAKKSLLTKQMIAAAAFGDAVLTPQTLAQKTYALTKDFGEARFRAFREVAQSLTNMGALLDQAIRYAQTKQTIMPLRYPDPKTAAFFAQNDKRSLFPRTHLDPYTSVFVTSGPSQEDMIAAYLEETLPLMKKRERIDIQLRLYAETAEQTIQYFAKYSGTNAEEWRADLGKALDTDIGIPAADHPDFMDRYNESAARLARAFIGIGNSSYEMATHNLNYIAALDGGKMWKFAAPGMRRLKEQEAENLREEVSVVRHFAENILKAVRGRAIEKKISTLNEQLILFQAVYDTAAGTDAAAQAEIVHAIFGDRDDTYTIGTLMEEFDTACSAAAKSRFKACINMIGNLSALDDLLSFKKAEAFKDYEKMAHPELPLDAQTVNSHYEDMARNLKERLMEFDAMAHRDARLLNETRDVRLAPMMHDLHEALLEQFQANTLTKHGNAVRDTILDNLMSSYADMATENLRSAIIWLGLAAAHKAFDLEMTEKEANHNEQTIASYIEKLDKSRKQVNEIGYQRLAAFNPKSAIAARLVN